MTQVTWQIGSANDKPDEGFLIQVTSREKSEALRHYLRRATAAQHDVLDNGAGVPDFTDARAHAAFLLRQLAARQPIEAWAALHCPADITPPPTVPALLADLDALGVSPDVQSEEFRMPADAELLGLAWALAGSHLGNRMMLKTLLETAPSAPHAFFADTDMIAFWQRLRPRLETEAAPDFARRAAAAADAVFARFIQAFGLSADGRMAA